MIEVSKKNKIIRIVVIGSMPLLLNGLYNLYLSYVPILYWTVEILTWVCLPLALYFYGYGKGLFTNRKLGFHTCIRGKTNCLILIILIIITAYFADAADNFFRIATKHLFPINYGKGIFTYRNVIPESGTIRIAVLLYFILSAGFVEEFYYRGLMKLIFEKTELPNFLYMVISSFVWAVMHWENGIHNMFSIFFLGILLSFLYLLYDNLWPVVVSHIFIDLKYFG